MKTFGIILIAAILVLGCTDEENVLGPAGEQAHSNLAQTMHFKYIGNNCDDVNLLAFVDYTDGRPVTPLFEPRSGRVESFDLDIQLPNEAFQINYHLHHSQSLLGTILDQEMPVGNALINLLQPGCFDNRVFYQDWLLEDCINICMKELIGN